MANPVWPVTLPQNPFALDGAKYIPVENRSAEQPSHGPAKARPTFTGEYDRFTFSLELVRAKYLILMAFYGTTLQRTRQFDWIDFRSGLVCQYRFAKKPSAQYVAGDGELWLCEIELERMP